MEAWTHAASQASPLAVQNAALRIGFVLPYGMAARLLVAPPLGLLASSRSRRASKQRCMASMLLGVLASKQLASVACVWAVRIPCRGPERKSAGGSWTHGKLDAMRYSGRVTGKERRGLDQRCRRADNAFMPPGVCAVQPRGARKHGKSMKAPHKSLLEHASKETTRYETEGAWLARIPTMDGSSRWAWCATNGRTAAVAYLDDADAKEAEEADSGGGRKNGLASTVFPLEVCERKGTFRLIPEGLRIASVAFSDGASFRLMDATPPMLDSIVRDEIRVGEKHRVNVYVNADLMIASLQAAVIGTRATRAGSKDDTERMVRLSFRVTEGSHESRDAIDNAAPIIVTPAKPENASKALVVCMPCSLTKDEDEAREKRVKAAVKAAKEREEELVALRRRVAELTREVARLEEAAKEVRT